MSSAENYSLLGRMPDTDKRRIIAAILIIIMFLTLIDITVDLIQGIRGPHIFAEAVIIPLAGFGLYFVWRGFSSAHESNRMLRSDLERVTAAAAQWKEDAAKYLNGLSGAIDFQLSRWGLSASEKEVALLLLKGLSHKEIAEVRVTSERTARQQALSVYAKAGLSGRAQLAAFFLEDLLAPQKNAY